MPVLVSNCRRFVRISLNLTFLPLAALCSTINQVSGSYFTRAMHLSTLHSVARGPHYPGTAVTKFPVQDEFVKWSVPYDDYRPVNYTSENVVKKPVWADPDLDQCNPDPPFQYNGNDEHYKVDRTSFTGKYEVIDGRPRNPSGRTGMVGRGLLGRWGPNHAADPVVTRWKTGSDGKRVTENGKPFLEFVAIKRKDNGQWALPGGMVEPGDTVSVTLRKEFSEEALNALELSEQEQAKIHKMLNRVFEQGYTLSQGYIDDPRNTDNSWMESVAVNFHDESGEAFNKFQLKAGDDAGAVQWLTISKDLELYASHKDIIHKAAGFHFAFW